MKSGAETHHRIVIATRAATPTRTGSAILHRIATAMATCDVIRPATASGKTTGGETGLRTATGRTPVISATTGTAIRPQDEAAARTCSATIAIAHLPIAHLSIARLPIGIAIAIGTTTIGGETCRKSATGTTIGSGKIPCRIVCGKKTVRGRRHRTLPEAQ